MISAKNISDISRTLAAHVPPAASVDDLVAGLRAQGRADDLEELLPHLPRGFALVPVWYEPIDMFQRDVVEREYTGSAARNTLKYIAANHADELRALGICETGIRQMRYGVYPHDQHGNRYDLSLDHILERSGSGRMGMEFAVDPLNPSDPKERLLINHVGNMILLPNQVHDFKNKLINMQIKGAFALDKPKWILSIVPVRDEKYSGFVCPPQPAGHVLEGLAVKRFTPQGCVTRTRFMGKQLVFELFQLRQEIKVYRPTQQALTRYHGQAQAEQTTVAELARMRPGKAGIAAKFMQVAEKQPCLIERIEQTVRPALIDFAHQVRHTFSVVAGIQYRGRAVYESFRGELDAPYMDKLRWAASSLPFPEAASVVKALHRIDLKIVADLEAEQQRAQRLLKPRKIA